MFTCVSFHGFDGSYGIFRFHDVTIYREALMIVYGGHRRFGVHETCNLFAMSTVVFLCRWKSVIRHDLDTVDVIRCNASDLNCVDYIIARLGFTSVLYNYIVHLSTYVHRSRAPVYPLRFGGVTG